MTLHYINLGEDTGDIIVQHEYEIPFGATMDEYMSGQLDCIEKCYKDGIQLLLSESIVAKQQAKPTQAKARKVTREDYLLDYNNWETKYAYHFLHGTDGASQIYNGGLYSYAVTGYKITDSVAKGNYDIQCKDGYVEVQRTGIPIKRFLKNVAKEILVRL